MKKWIFAIVVLSALAGGAAAIWQRYGKTGKLHVGTACSVGVIGEADGPTSVIFAHGTGIPHTCARLLRKISAAICRFAAACLCGSHKKNGA